MACNYIVNNQLLNEEQFLEYLNRNLDSISVLDNRLLFHEILHPFIDSLFVNNNKELMSVYNSYIKTKDGQDTLRFVNDNYKLLTDSEKVREVLVRGVEQEKDKPKSWANRLLNLLKDLLGIDNLTFNSSITDLANAINRIEVKETNLKSLKQRNVFQHNAETTKRIIQDHVSANKDWVAKDGVYEKGKDLAIRVTTFIQDYILKDTKYSYKPDEIIKSNAYNNFVALIKTTKVGLQQFPTMNMVKAAVSTLDIDVVRKLIDSKLEQAIIKSQSLYQQMIYNNIAALSKQHGIDYNQAVNYINSRPNGITPEEEPKLAELKKSYEVLIGNYYQNVITSPDHNVLLEAIHFGYKQLAQEELIWKSQISKAGTLIHKIMENITAQYGDNKVINVADIDKVSDDDIEDLIPTLFNTEKDEYLRIKKSLVDEFNTKIYPMIKGKMILSEVKLAGTVDINGESKPIMGTSDLVVINDDGTYFIIDYKSSLKAVEQWNQGKIQTVNTQMHVYHTMLKKLGLVPITGRSGYSVNLQLNATETNFDNNGITTLKGLGLKNAKNDPIVKSETKSPYKDILINKYFGIQNEVTTNKNNNPIRKWLKRFFNWELDDSVAVTDEQINKKVEYYMKSTTRGYRDMASKKFVPNPFYIPKKDELPVFKTETSLNKAKESYETSLRDYIKTYLPIEKNQALSLSNYITEMGDYEYARRYQSNSFLVMPTLYQLDYWNNKNLSNLDPVIKKYWEQYTTINSVISPVWENVSTSDSLNLGLILMKSRTTGVVEVINVSNQHLSELHPLNNTKAKTFFSSWVASDSIAGNFLTEDKDEEARLMEANWGNLESIKAVLYLMNNPTFDRVGQILTISPSDDSLPVNKKLSEVTDQVKRLIDVTKVDEEFNEKIKLFNAYSKKITVYDELDELNNYYLSLLETLDRPSIDVKKQSELYNSESKLNKQEKLAALYRRQTYLTGKANLSTEEEQELVLISRVILAAADLEVFADEADITQFYKNATQPDEQISPLFKRIRDLVIKARQNIKREYAKSLDILRDTFRNYYSNVGRLNILINDDMYVNLYEFETTDLGNRVNTLRLRDPDSTTYDYASYNQSSLTDYEKQFLRGLIKELTRIKARTSVDFTKVDVNKFNRELPIIERDSLTRFAESLGFGNEQDAFRYIKDSGGFVSNSTKSTMNPDRNFKTKFYTFLSTQVRPESRNQQMADIKDPVINIENLVMLLSYNTNREIEYNKILPVISAIKVMISLSSFSWFKNYPELLEYINSYVESTVFGRSGLTLDQEEFSKNIGVIKNFVSLYQLGFNIKTAGLQAVTSILGTITAFSGQGSHLLSKKGFATGLKYAVSPTKSAQDFMHQLHAQYDIRNVNPESLMYDERVNKSVGNYISSSMMWFNSVADTTFRKAMWISQAVKDGTLKFENGDISPDSALQMIDGVIVYDPSKDDRYSDYFTNGPKYNEHKALYEAKVLRAKKDGTFDTTTGLPMYAYDSRELEAKQKLISDTYADMTSENKTKFERTVLGMLWIQFKRFMFAKKNQYYSDVKETRTGEYKILMIDGKPALNEDGTVVEYWEGDIHEGILQTLSKIGKQLINQPGQILAMGDTLTDYQKRNLKHLASDVMLLAASYLLVLAAGGDDEEEKDKNSFDDFVQFIYNANKSSFFLNVATEASTTSPFASISIMYRLFSNVGGHLTEGELGKTVEDVLRSAGVTKSGINLYENVTDEKLFEE